MEAQPAPVQAEGRGDLVVVALEERVGVGDRRDLEAQLRLELGADREHAVADMQVAVDHPVAAQREAAVGEAEAMARRETPLDAEPAAGGVLVGTEVAPEVDAVAGAGLLAVDLYLRAEGRQ